MLISLNCPFWLLCNITIYIGKKRMKAWNQLKIKSMVEKALYVVISGNRKEKKEKTEQDKSEEWSTEKKQQNEYKNEKEKDETIKE